MNEQLKARISKFSNMLDDLISAQVYRLGDVVAELPPASAVPGVYLFSLPSQPASLVYAGRTKAKTIVGRFKDHQRLKTPSDLRGMLLRLPDVPQSASDYGARWLAVPDHTERSQFELFIISILAPPFNRYNVPAAIPPEPVA